MIARILIVLAVLLPAQPGWAQSCDQDCALGLVRSGEILPLEAIVDSLPVSGRLADARLHRDGRSGRWIYRLRLLTSGNRVREVVVDAASGRILETAGRAPR